MNMTQYTGSRAYLDIDSIYDRLMKFYNPLQKQGIAANELFDSSKSLVKPYAVCNHYEPSYTEGMEETILNAKLDALSKAFDVNPVDWAVSKDCRSVTKDGKLQYLLSFRFVLKTKKTCIDRLREVVASLGDPDFDMSFYRAGLNRFALPYTKKHKDILNSLLVPVTDTTKETFENHVVSYTEGCELFTGTKFDPWFDEHYEITKDNNNFVSLAEIYREFRKIIATYPKRKNESNLEETLKDNQQLKHNSKVDDVMKKRKNVFLYCVQNQK